MKILIWLLKKLYLNRKAYALNEYRYYKQNDSKEYISYWRIETVIIECISIDNNEITYEVRDAKTFESWGDYTNKVFLTKSSATKALSKIN